MCDCGGCEPIGVIADRLVGKLAAGISTGEDRETPAGHSAGRTGAVVVNLDVAGCRLRRGSAEPARHVTDSLPGCAGTPLRGRAKLGK